MVADLKVFLNLGAKILYLLFGTILLLSSWFLLENYHVAYIIVELIGLCGALILMASTITIITELRNEFRHRMI
ncbi:MAG: hypothetical protein M1165_00105 [Candidatus Pacearchaeota archaeon]|nr:hypothetical protein [Candidatus Pacearchaeota archaeon]